MLRWSWIALAVFVADQATKLAALQYLPRGDIALAPFLNLTLVFNKGAAFGLLSQAGGWQNLFFIAVAVVVSIVIVVMLRRLDSDQRHLGVALLLVLGGALGNIADRLRLGYVVDFIDFHYGAWHWYTFNVADAAITVGAVILALDAFGIGFKRKVA